MKRRDEFLAFYARLGLETLPLRPREKRPLYAGWQTPSPNAWARAPPDANVGIICGEASGGLVVLDFDTPNGLEEAMGMRPASLAAHTLVTRTSRGWHVYARDGRERTRSPWKGLDVRGQGSMVVAPPSVHPSGVEYAFLDARAPIAPLSALPIDLEPLAQGRPAPAELDWDGIESWIGLQATKLQTSWRLLRHGGGGFDRSRADFAVARCLWEAGYSVDEVAAVLLALPGSKAQERGEPYARRTAMKAARDRADRKDTRRSGGSLT